MNTTTIQEGKKERATLMEETTNCERAEGEEKTKNHKRAISMEETTSNKRPMLEDVLAVRMLVRSREDFQSIRKKMFNRLGIKADGDNMNIQERSLRLEDIEMIKGIADACKNQEVDLEKKLKKVLKRFPVYNEFLEQVKGVGCIAAGWIISEFDIHKADTVSKMWQFAGLNPGMVRGKKDIDKKKYKPEMGEVVREYTAKEEERIVYLTDTMVRGDKNQEGFVSPYNKSLRTALVGVLADGFIKQQNYYCMTFYYPYKERLEREENEVMHCGKDTAWNNVSKGHRDRAAKRYMIKMFLKDLYAAWRDIEGLPVRVPYQEEYLGHKH